MEYPHSIFMLKIKQGILYDHSTEIWLKLIYVKYIFIKFQSLVRYGIILWGGEIESVRVLKIQKRALCAVKGLNKRESCRPIFKELKILTVTALYIFEVLCCFRKNNIYVRKNLDMYEYNTRRKCDFHVPSLLHHSLRGVW